MPRAKNGLKICPKCEFEKKITEFTVERSRKDGRYPYCKDCQREKLRPLMRKIMMSRPEQKKKGTLKHFYGITLQQFTAMLEIQNNTCAICGRHQDELGYILGVDHDHCTGKIRGLLCRRCNVLLGFAKDSIEILEKAILYLK